MRVLFTHTHTHTRTFVPNSITTTTTTICCSCVHGCYYLRTYGYLLSRHPSLPVIDPYSVNNARRDSRTISGVLDTFDRAVSFRVARRVSSVLDGSASTTGHISVEPIGQCFFFFIPSLRPFVLGRETRSSVTRY